MTKSNTILAVVSLFALGVLVSPVTAQRSNPRNVAAQDRNFVVNATSGGLYEVRSSQIAVQKSQNEHVRAIAQRMIADHTRANTELLQIAGRAGVTPPRNMNRKHQNMVAKLQRLSGAAFDREYVKQQLAAHRESIALYERNTRNGRNQDLRGFATRTLPILREHLQHIQTHGAPVTGGNQGNSNNKNKGTGGHNH